MSHWLQGVCRSAHPEAGLMYRTGTGTAMGLADFFRATRFAIVGAVNTGVDVGIFSALVFGFGMALVPANALAYLVASTSSYFANRIWTFKGKTAPAGVRDYLTFQLVNGIGFVLATVVLVILANYLPTLVAKLLSIGASFSWSFFMLDRFVWNRGSGSGEGR